MEISVFGKQIDIGEALRAHIEFSLTGGVAKYFDRPGQAQVTFSHEGVGFRCDCSVHFNAGILLQSTGEASDIYASFEAVAGREYRLGGFETIEFDI
jgi:ribosomal subunit interface protein